MNQLTDQDTRSQHGSNAYASILGAGSGTLMLVIAKEIPDTHWIKSYLIMTAPSISVYLSNIASEVNAFFAEVKQNIRRKRKEKKIIRKIKALKNCPSATDKDVQMLTRELKNSRIDEIRKIIISLNG